MKAKARAVAVWWWPIWTGVIIYPAICAVLSIGDGSVGLALAFGGIALWWVVMLMLWIWLRDDPSGDDR